MYHVPELIEERIDSSFEKMEVRKFCWTSKPDFGFSSKMFPMQFVYLSGVNTFISLQVK